LLNDVKEMGEAEKSSRGAGAYRHTGESRDLGETRRDLST
jgi:hypothetical protein